MLNLGVAFLNIHKAIFKVKVQTIWMNEMTLQQLSFQV